MTPVQAPHSCYSFQCPSFKFAYKSPVFSELTNHCRSLQDRWVEAERRWDHGRTYTVHIWGEEHEVPCQRHWSSDLSTGGLGSSHEVGGCKDFPVLSRAIQGDRCHWDQFVLRGLNNGKARKRSGISACPLSSHAFLSGLWLLPQNTDTMLPPLALPSMSWMLLSCLMILAQVQGEISLFLAWGSCECSGPIRRGRLPW